MKNTVILCDFDGTIIKNDGCDTLMINHSVPEWETPGKKYLAGEISHAEMNEAFVKMLSAHKSDLVNTIKNKLQIRDGFKSFFKQIIDNNIIFIIISAGWDLYITETLNFIDFKYIHNSQMLIQHIEENHKEIPLITNRIVTNENSTSWRIDSPWLNEACQKSTPCKGKIAQALKEAKYNVIAIGNSETDVCMTEYADITFATGSLVSILNEQGNNFSSFETFDDISTQLFNKSGDKNV